METISANPSTFARAAASSIANGSPSTRRDTSAASARSSASGSKPGRAARARSRKSSTAAERRILGAVSASGERRDGHPGFACDAQRLAARRQDPQSWALLDERRRDPSCLVENVLTGVENDERAGVAKT